MIIILLGIAQIKIYQIIKCALHTLKFKRTGCPKSSFLYFIRLHFSTIGLGKQVI